VGAAGARASRVYQVSTTAGPCSTGPGPSWCAIRWRARPETLAVPGFSDL